MKAKKILDEFYYQQTRSGAEYTIEPTGNISVPQLLNNQKDFWRKPALPITKKPQTLILSDWTTGNWDNKKIQNVTRTLAHYLHHGFTIYIVSNGKLIPLQKDNLAELQDPYIRNGMKPAFEADLIAKVNLEKKLSCEEIRILDDYWVERMLTNDSTLTHSLRVSDVLKVEEINNIFNHNIFFSANLLSILSNAMPKFTRIIHDEFSNKANALATRLQEHLQIDLTTEYKRVHLENDRELDPRYRLTNPQFQNIQALELDSLKQDNETKTSSLISKSISMPNELLELTLQELPDLNRDILPPPSC